MYVSEELYAAVADAMNEWRQSGAARLLVGPTAFRPALSAMFKDDHPDIIRFIEEQDISLSELRHALNDLVDVLGAEVVGVPDDRFAQIRASSDRLEDGSVEDAEVAIRKRRVASDRFDIEDFRRRAWLKETSKSQIVIELDWEVVAKHADEGEQSPDGRAAGFANLRLRAEPPENRSAAFPQIPAEVVFMADHEDVDYLVAALSRLKEELEALRERDDVRTPTP
jgi:hypothetical protein